MRRRVDSRVLVALGLLALALALLVGSEALARPGGGEGYGGGSGGGGGGGGGDGELFVWLLILCIEHPAIGIPLLIVFLVVAWLRKRGEAKQKAWSTSAAGVPHVQQVTRAALVPRAALDQIRSIDPGFSTVLFEDFAYLLYAELQRARAQGTASLTAFVAPAVAQSIVDPRLADVRGVIIGAMRIVQFSGVHVTTVQVQLELESNYVEIDRQGGQQRYYAVDCMRLGRSRDAKSRPMDRARTLDCPNCGASIEQIRGTRCLYCNEEVGGGRFDWNVEQFWTQRREGRGPNLISHAEEVGTDQPTRVDPGANHRMHALAQRDPSFNWDVFQHRVGHIFGQLQLGWSNREPMVIRPFVSDNLFQSMMYWLDLYRLEGCRNINEGARILRIDLANVLSDASFDAITVRLFATGLDYTVSDNGQLLSGSKSKPRTYSEYWTLIRGVNRQGQSKGDQSCPNCGAALNISMVGNCAYCDVKVTAGAFDWVLSRIEQDESYTG